MMLQHDPIFSNEAAALEYVTAIRWPRGPYCPFCLQTENLMRAVGSGSVPRYSCPCCQNAFTTITATLFERDSVPLSKWLRSLESLSLPRRRSLPAMLQMALASADIDPELRLVADGRPVRPSRVDHLSFCFHLPSPISELVLHSRHVVPAEQGVNSIDARRLGVSLRAIEREAGDTRRSWGHDDPALVDGFHPAEATHRWTTGYAVLPADIHTDIGAPFIVRVQLANLSLRYPPA